MKMPEPEKFILNLEKASQSLRTADHLTYMTFPLLKENRLLLKILEEIHSSLIDIMNAVLQYEYTYKRIQIYKDARENFNTFRAIAKRYNIKEEQINKIIEILRLEESHKKSPFEFVRNGKIVIMSDNLKTSTITLGKMKEYLLEVKDILRKANFVIRLTQKY
ncbi:MAG: hypothetical protein AABX71_03245 [Nanoarchaeota archaeon]